MNTLYKNKNGQVYSISPIQKPKEDWIKLTEEEIELILNPPLTTEQIYTNWKSERQNKIDNLEVVHNDIVYQGDELSQTRIARAISVMDDIETTQWVAKDNSIQTLNKADLSAILKEAGIKQTLIWNENRPEAELGGL